MKDELKVDRPADPDALEWRDPPPDEQPEGAGAVGASVGRVQRLHERIKRILGEAPPTQAEEQSRPEESAERYDEIAARLRALTDDRERFPHLFAENVNYGQRRNMLGLRPSGIQVAAITLLVAGLAIAFANGQFSDRLTRFGPGAVVGLAMLAFWTFIVSRDWVLVTADAYADQFVAAINKLHHERVADPASRSADATVHS